MAHAMALMANIWKGKDVKPFTTEDFMPKVKEEGSAAEQQSWQQQLSIVQALHAAFKANQEQKRLKAG
jgi:hypothetical protein